MPTQMRATFLSILLLSSVGIAGEKKKTALPDYVLDARTIVVVVTPEAGVSMMDPGANRTAVEDVEKAIMRWGRYKLVLEGMNPDLILAVRKSNGKAVNPTVSGPSPNDRPVIVQSDGGGTTRIGVQKGHPPDLSSGPGGPQNTGPRPGAETAPPEDFFAVYQGTVDHPLDNAPVWLYAAKDALRSPNVPAVGEFRKAVDEAEKQRKKKP